MEKRTSTINFRTPQRFREFLEREAEKNDVSIADIMNQIIRKTIEERKKENE